MSTVKLELEVPKETYEVIKGLVKFAKDVKAALGDGFQVGDLPAILASVMSPEAMAAIQGVDLVAGEVKADPAGAALAAGAALKEVLA